MYIISCYRLENFYGLFVNLVLEIGYIFVICDYLLYII